MTINRRRAPSSAISSEKKISGHKNEEKYAKLIKGKVIAGTKKSDVVDQAGSFHSVKSGKKWQIFLYGYERIKSSQHLNVLLPCLEAFPSEADLYFKDRTKCIAYKENYVRTHGKEKARLLSSYEVALQLGHNLYVESKNDLAVSTTQVKGVLEDKKVLRNFLDEAIFNNSEVKYLAIKDTHYFQDNAFKVFQRTEVLDVLSEKLYPSVSKAGLVPEDYNVAGQKTLLCYNKSNGEPKNIVEIEIRNDSPIHYRQVRFNMYSKDTLNILIDYLDSKVSRVKSDLFLFGKAISTLATKI